MGNYHPWTRTWQNLWLSLKCVLLLGQCQIKRNIMTVLVLKRAEKDYSKFYLPWIPGKARQIITYASHLIMLMISTKIFVLLFNIIFISLLFYSFSVKTFSAQNELVCHVFCMADWGLWAAECQKGQGHVLVPALHRVPL